MDHAPLGEGGSHRVLAPSSSVGVKCKSATIQTDRGKLWRLADPRAKLTCLQITALHLWRGEFNGYVIVFGLGLRHDFLLKNRARRKSSARPAVANRIKVSQTVAFCYTQLELLHFMLAPRCQHERYFTSYDCFRQISTLSTTFDRFRHFAARITHKSAVQRPKTSVVEHKGLGCGAARLS